ncbi:tyrosine-type recombinase/integrase [Pseudomonas helleri]|uniref:tyrosine-type recombinase/integrase n=1 Tax=Pseudomonas helleri TaxID=1608996 RepID=UPI00389A6FF7
MADNLIQKKGESTWYVRLAVPIDVRKAMGGKTVLIQSLKTGLRSEAMNRRLSILSDWKAAFAAARKKRALPEEWQTSVISQLQQFDQLATDQKRKLIGETVPDLPAADPKMLAKIMADPDLVEIITTLVKTKRANGLTGDLQHEDFLANMFKRMVPLQLMRRHQLTAQQRTELETLTKDPSSYKSKSPINKARLAIFREHRQGRAIAAKTIDQQESKLEKLSDFLKAGERSLDFDAVSAWLDSLKLTSKTLTQYLLAGSVFWRWAMKHDVRWREDFKDRANPFENHDLPQVRGKAKTDAQRKDFNLEDIAKLHAAASIGGHATLADLILLGTYTGARIEELCQLKAEHVIEPDGIKSFDIVDSKTAAGIRSVPIHPALATLVDRLVEQSKDGYLVPSDNMNKYGIRSDALSKAFGRLKEAQGFGSQHVFHSIRKTVVTQLHRADVRSELIAELIGHETGTVTFDVYSQGATTAQKLVAISKLPSLRP